MLTNFKSKCQTERTTVSKATTWPACLLTWSRPTTTSSTSISFSNPKLGPSPNLSPRPNLLLIHLHSCLESRKLYRKQALWQRQPSLLSRPNRRLRSRAKWLWKTTTMAWHLTRWTWSNQRQQFLFPSLKTSPIISRLDSPSQSKHRNKVSK